MHTDTRIVSRIHDCSDHAPPPKTKLLSVCPILPLALSSLQTLSTSLARESRQNKAVAPQKLKKGAVSLIITTDLGRRLVSQNSLLQQLFCTRMANVERLMQNGGRKIRLVQHRSRCSARQINIQRHFSSRVGFSLPCHSLRLFYCLYHRIACLFFILFPCLNFSRLCKPSAESRTRNKHNRKVTNLERGSTLPQAAKYIVNISLRLNLNYTILHFHSTAFYKTPFPLSNYFQSS